jgi:hypothetical protein
MKFFVGSGTPSSRGIDYRLSVLPIRFQRAGRPEGTFRIPLERPSWLTCVDKFLLNNDCCSCEQNGV